MKTLFIILMPIISLLVYANTGRIGAQLSTDGQTLILSGYNAPKSLSLDPPNGFDVDGEPKIFGAKDFTVILVEFTDAETSNSKAYALGPKGQMLWSKDLFSFNASPVLIEENHVYLASLGHVFKVNKHTGSEVWALKGLYEIETIKFAGGEPIKRKGKLIQFSHNLHVNDETGKIVGEAQ